MLAKRTSKFKKVFIKKVFIRKVFIRNLKNILKNLFYQNLNVIIVINVTVIN